MLEFSFRKCLFVRDRLGYVTDPEKFALEIEGYVVLRTGGVLLESFKKQPQKTSSPESLLP